MNWARERDLLIAQTMMFVQSVTGKKPEAEARADFTPVDEIEAAERPVAITPASRPSPVYRSEVREEIQGRVAAFRAHQQLFHRELDAYFDAVLAKLRAPAESRPKAPGN
jgi:hypothetical protein